MWGKGGEAEVEGSLGCSKPSKIYGGERATRQYCDRLDDRLDDRLQINQCVLYQI
jgi:hypothetical protein